MNQELKNKIETCLWRDKINEIPAAVEQYIDEIDFYDDDDMEILIDFVIRAACNHKDTSLLEYLVSKGMDVNFKLLGKDCLILRLADRSTDAGVFKKFAELGADVYSENNNGDNVLILASRRVFKSLFGKDNLDELTVHIVNNYDLSKLDKADKFGITPLMYAVINDKLQLAEALIERGVNVNGTGTSPSGGFSYWMDMNGISPLALAIRHGNLQIFEKLLAAGADVNAQDNDGNTALLLACSESDEKTARFLLRAGADVDKLNDDGESPLILAVAKNNLVIAELLLAAGANANSARLDGTAPLHVAAKSGEHFIGKALINAGADKNVKTADGKTPLILAAQCGRNDFTAMLIEAGADLNAVDNNRHSAMHYASEAGFTEIVEQLLSGGAEN